MFNKTAGILIVVFAIYTINSQLNVLGLKSLSDLDLRSNDTASEKVDQEVSENPDVDENVQKLVIVADDFSYTPQGSMTIEAVSYTHLDVYKRQDLKQHQKTKHSTGLKSSKVICRP